MGTDIENSSRTERVLYDLRIQGELVEVTLHAVSLTQLKVLKRLLASLAELVKGDSVKRLVVDCAAIDYLSFSLVCKFVLFNLNRQANELGVTLKAKGLNAQTRETLKSMGLSSLGRA